MPRIKVKPPKQSASMVLASCIHGHFATRASNRHTGSRACSCGASTSTLGLPGADVRASRQSSRGRV
eukprot:4230993-Pleurochrysis_carterae.AAC.2